jgi:hypothetical protein
VYYLRYKISCLKHNRGGVLPNGPDAPTKQALTFSRLNELFFFYAGKSEPGFNK